MLQKGTVQNSKLQNDRLQRVKALLENIAVVILAFYPLRHVTCGLDLWDTGYNYANFLYMGMEHMDPMWLFSTYLSNVVGHFLTMLPNADSLMGMNVYTGLFVSALALAGYFFCKRALKMPFGIAFLGEMLAISLCWSPTAVLYNYLTYAFYMTAVILLYYGLAKENRKCLLAAGVCLGANVLVRFSNLPEAAMIVAVWAYDFICVRGERRSNRGGEPEQEKTAVKQAKAEQDRTAYADTSQGFFGRTLRHTGWCLLGYLAALLVLLGYIAVRYGLDEYVTGITRLFAMTENATDYKATSMLMGVIGAYVENLYWVVRIAIVIAGGTLMLTVVRTFCERLTGKLAGGSLQIFYRAAQGLWIGVSGAVLVWLYYRKFCSFNFFSYDSMWRPGVLFLMLAMLIAVIHIFRKKSTREEKLIGGLVLLVVLLTSIGSNNGVYPSMNNLFIAAPYTLYESWKFVRYVREIKIARVIIPAFAMKTVLIVFIMMCTVQFGGFGAQFVFAEATGVQDFTAGVENNTVLKNIKMSPDKAKCMTEISAYVNENSLQGQEVILYGEIPALSFYLQMPSAFNPWSDLRSYSFETMKGELAELGEEKPVIILGSGYTLFKEGGAEALKTAGLSEKKQQTILSDTKWELLSAFMKEKGYEQVLHTEKFSMYR